MEDPPLTAGDGFEAKYNVMIMTNGASGWGLRRVACGIANSHDESHGSNHVVDFDYKKTRESSPLPDSKYSPEHQTTASINKTKKASFFYIASIVSSF